MSDRSLRSCLSSSWFYSGLAWLFMYFAAQIVLRKMNLDLSSGARVTIAIAPVIPAAVFLLLLIRDIARLDELQRQIHLEALGFAFPLSILFLMTLGLLQFAVDLNPEEWSYRHIWFYPPIFYFLGLTIASHRYK